MQIQSFLLLLYIYIYTRLALILRESLKKMQNKKMQKKRGTRPYLQPSIISITSVEPRLTHSTFIQSYIHTMLGCTAASDSLLYNSSFGLVSHDKTRREEIISI